MTARGRSVWRRYVFSLDHKVIGVQYAITAMVFLLAGFGLMLLMRWQLAYPGQPIPLVGAWLGERNAPGGVMLPEFCNQLGAMHGTIMIFLGVVPLATIATAGQTWWLAGMVLIITSNLLGSLNFITTIIQLRAPGLTFMRLPFLVWAQLVTAFLLLLAFPPLESAAIFQLMDRGRAASNNPWDATTLEWTTTSPPPHGNFERTPTVYRGAYEYSVPGRTKDFLMQTDD